MEKATEQTEILVCVVSDLRKLLVRFDDPRLFANTICKAMNDLLAPHQISLDVAEVRKETDSTNEVGLHAITEADERLDARSNSVSASNVHRFVGKEQKKGTPILSRIQALDKANTSDAIPSFDSKLKFSLAAFPDLNTILGRIELNSTCFVCRSDPVYTATPDGVIKLPFMWIPVEIYEYNEPIKKQRASENSRPKRKNKDASPQPETSPEQVVQKKNNDPDVTRKRLQEMHKKQQTRRNIAKNEPEIDLGEIQGSSESEEYKPSRAPKKTKPDLGKRAKRDEIKDPRVLVEYANHANDATDKKLLAALAKKTLEAAPINQHVSQKIQQLRCAMLCMDSPLGLLIRIRENAICHSVCHQTFEFIARMKEQAPVARSTINLANSLPDDVLRTLHNSKISQQERLKMLTEADRTGHH